MSTSPVPVLPQTIKRTFIQILPATASGLVTLATGGANGTKIVAAIATSSDTGSGRDVTIGITNGGTFMPLGTVTVPVQAGQVANTPAVNMLDPAKIPGLPVDSDGQPYIFLASASDTLQVKSLTTVTAAKELDFNAFGADF